MNRLEIEHAQLHNKLRKLGGMLVSLEEYRQLAQQGMTRQAATVVASDMIRISKHIGLDTVSLEQHADLNNVLSHALSMEDGQGIGKTISEAIKRFVEWLKKAYATVKDQIGALLTSFTAIRDKVETLKGTAKSLNNPVKVFIPARWAQQVGVQGELALDKNFSLLKQLANFGAVAYPEAVNDFYIDLASVVTSFDPSNDADTMVKAVEESLTPLNFQNIDSQTYPGNVMIVPDESGYNYSIAEVEARKIEEEIELTTRSSAEIISALNEILKVVDIAEKLEGVSANIETSINKVIEATDTLGTKTKDADENKQRNANALINIVLSNTAKLHNSSASIISYLGRVLTTHLKIIEHEIKVATTSQKV